MNPLVSILVPIYNVQNYIERCARSLFNQTYDNIEFIFVNDSSPDNSVFVLNTIIEEYINLQDRIKLISHETNKGLAASRLTGIDNASGDYLMFVDSDDYLELNAVQVLMEKAMESDFEIVTGGIRHVFDDKSYVSLPPNDISPDRYLKLILACNVSHNTVSRVYKKELFMRNNNLFIEGINSGEDYLMVSRIFYYAKNIAFVYAPLYNYLHINPISFTSHFSKKNYYQQKEAESIVRKFYEEKGEKEFLEAQIIGCLKAKAQNIILVLLNDYNISDYNEVTLCNVDDEKQFLSKTPFQYRIILQMVKVLGHRVMSKLVRFGFNVKGFLKGLKL